MSWEEFIPKDIAEKYEVHEYKHAAVILRYEFGDEFQEVMKALRDFSITISDITTPGGNESAIPKKLSAILRPLGWEEKKLKAEMRIDGELVGEPDTHKVDYVKTRVAFDLEWNSKDQTFDRDLFAFKTFFDYGKISVAVLVTRSRDLDEVFAQLGDDCKKKYGASTTHMGKLLTRLDAGRNGGCPVLVFGIKRECISDYKKKSANKR